MLNQSGSNDSTVAAAGRAASAGHSCNLCLQAFAGVLSLQCPVGGPNDFHRNVPRAWPAQQCPVHAEARQQLRVLLTADRLTLVLSHPLPIPGSPQKQSSLTIGLAPSPHLLRPNFLSGHPQRVSTLCSAKRGCGVDREAWTGVHAPECWSPPDSYQVIVS